MLVNKESLTQIWNVILRDEQKTFYVHFKTILTIFFGLLHSSEVRTFRSELLANIKSFTFEEFVETIFVYSKPF